MKLQIVVSWEICELNGMPLVVFGILLPRGASTLGLFGTRLVTVTGKLQYTNRQSFFSGRGHGSCPMESRCERALIC